MEATWKRMVQYVDASLVYTTPYACVWNAYCDSLVHSLVVVDRTRDVALIVNLRKTLVDNALVNGQKERCGR